MRARRLHGVARHKFQEIIQVNVSNILVDWYQYLRHQCHVASPAQAYATYPARIFA
jgi:hypothetical protein